MGDNKISEAVELLPCPFCGGTDIDETHVSTYSLDSSYDVFGCLSCGANFEDGTPADWNQRVAPAHLQGEAVPVAWIDLTKLSRSKMVYASAYQIEPSQVPVFNPPQPAELSLESWSREMAAKEAGQYVGAGAHGIEDKPAELNEVSGNSGGLGDQKEFIYDIYTVAGTPGMTPVDLADWIRDVLLRSSYDLAATGKQQVGEVQGSREQFEAWRGGDLERREDGAYVNHHARTDWSAWQAAIASRQPVGLSPIATRKLEELAAQGYVTNGVAIFNPETSKRGLVDNLGYVGWQGANGVDSEQLIRLRNDLHTMSKHGVKDGWQDAAIELVADVTKLIDGRDAGTGVE